MSPRRRLCPSAGGLARRWSMRRRSPVQLPETGRARVGVSRIKAALAGLRPAAPGRVRGRRPTERRKPGTAPPSPGRSSLGIAKDGLLLGLGELPRGLLALTLDLLGEVALGLEVLFGVPLLG